MPRKIPCEIWSRIVGYFRPVDQWNPGKQEEFRERKPYQVGPAILKEEVKDVSMDKRS